MAVRVLRLSAENNCAKFKGEVVFKEKGSLVAQLERNSLDFEQYFRTPDQTALEFESAVVIGKGYVNCGKPELDGIFEFRIDAPNVKFEDQSALFNLTQTRRPVQVKLVILPFDVADNPPGETTQTEDAEITGKSGEGAEDAPEGQGVPTPNNAESLLHGLTSQELAVYQASTQFGNKYDLWVELLAKEANDTEFLDLAGDVFSELIETNSAAFNGEGMLGWAVIGGQSPKIFIGTELGVPAFVGKKNALHSHKLVDAIKEVIGKVQAAKDAERVDADFEVVDSDESPADTGTRALGF